jgi:O-antigen biosynthesis protein
MRHLTLLEQILASTSPGPFFKPDAIHPPAPSRPRVRVIAFYVPRLHPFPENSTSWGFTEWMNVAKALPRFVGHVQPRLPIVGFYDPQNLDVIREQAKLARRYGVGGFCFHYYWCNGHRPLETPLNLLLADPSIALPFCINWTNGNWTRRLDGLESDLGQSYSPQDDTNFARGLVPIVRDPRYIRVNGRPLIVICSPTLLPEPVATMRRWRAEFARAGVGNPYIAMIQSFDALDPRLYGVDAATELPPHKLAVTPRINNELSILDPNFEGHVIDYGEVARHAMSLPAPPFKLFRGVSPGWDNEARRPGRGFTLANSTPVIYGDWLAAACASAVAENENPDERIVFVNAWNEWAEGAYLEPDSHFGYAYLAETARALSSLDEITPRRTADGDLRIALVSHNAYRYGAQLNALAITRSLAIDLKVSLNVLLGGPGELTPEFEALAPTEIVPGNFTDQGAWTDAARRLAASGVTAVICNTLVSARAIGPLRQAGLRIVQLVHELPTLIQQYGLTVAARDAAAHAAVIVFPCSYVRDRFIEIAGPIRNRTLLRHQGIYLRGISPTERRSQRAATRRALGIGDDRRVVLGVGSGDMRKGLDLWPNLARKVLNTCPDAVLLWVGHVEPSVRPWLEHDLRTAGIEDRLLLPGEFENMAGIYAAADVYALTSREDPFPSAVLEAMASGLPIVVFENSGGIVELVRNAGGISVPYLDVEAMARELASLLCDSAAASEIGASMARSIGSKFDFAHYCADVLALAVPPELSVSVVVPNYNYGRYLRQRLESIWAQRVTIRQIILLDDASTDDSEAVMVALARESPLPIRIVRNEVNSGSVSRQWARGVSLAECDLVWIAEADDFADPDFLKEVLPTFEDPEVVLSYTESRIVNAEGEVTSPNYLHYVADISATRWTSDFRAPGPVEVATALAIKNTIPNASAVVFRRDALSFVLHNYLDEMASYRNAADWLCYIRLLSRGGKLAFTAHALNNHRRHISGVTVSAADQRHLDEITAMQDLAASLVPVQAETRASARQYRIDVANYFRFLSAETV